MSHVLRLGQAGRFGMNVVDDVIVVHHQETKTSLLFDIALRGDPDPIDNVTRHSPLTTGRPMKPFYLRLPSISNEHMEEVELCKRSMTVTATYYDQCNEISTAYLKLQIQNPG